MEYPTLEQVESADHEQLCRWYRFLPPPGTRAIGKAGADLGSFYDVLFADAKILERIVHRVRDLGGFTPEISKKIGWDR